MKSPHERVPQLPSASRSALGLAILGLGLFGLASSASAQSQSYAQNFGGGTAPSWVAALGTWGAVSGTPGYYQQATYSDASDISYYNGLTFDTNFTYTANVELHGSGSSNDGGLIYYYQNSTNFYEVELNRTTSIVALYEHISSSSGTVVASSSFTPSGGTYQSVQINRNGPITTVTVNGVPLITQSETSLTGGGYIGTCDRWCPVQVTDINVTSTPYFQDFTTGTAPSWSAGIGTWAAVSGTPGYYQQATYSDAFDYAYSSGSKFDTNFSYTANVEIHGSGSSNDGGLIYYYQNSTNFYEVELNRTTSTVALYEHINSAAGTIVASSSFTSSGGTYQALQIVRNGTTTMISVNGVLCITRTEAGLSGGGYIGTCDRWSPVQITNIRAAALYNPNFPRLALYPIGSNQSYPTNVWSTYAKFNVVVIGGNWEGWADPNGVQRAYTREDVVTGIKSASTIGTKVIQYVAFNETPPSTGAPNFPTWTAACDTNTWWLYATGTTGARVVPTDNSNDYYTNMTHDAPVDGSGLRPYQWAANYSYDMFITGTVGSASQAPALDGFYLDNVFWKPRTGTGGVDGDWNRDGTGDSDTNSATQLSVRTGETDFYSEMNSLLPIGTHIGNNADWYDASTTDPTAITPLSGVLKGGILEGAIGQSYSGDSLATNSFSTMLAYYNYVMITTAPPNLQAFDHEKLYSDGHDSQDSTLWHALRYGLGTALMNNGYYMGESTAGHSGNLGDIYWFDEYDNAGAGEGYLGQPVSGATGAVQTAARWNYGTYGVWAREFANGLVIVNPKGNGTQTLTTTDLGGSGVWKRINGTQDTTTNNGTVVTSSITIAARDGLILLRN